MRKQTELYSDKELEQLHHTELQILKEITRICQENNITFFAIYGTMLGAIRHQGIIPWDDDIDVAMLREDYDKFISIAKSELKPGYFLQHFTTDKNTSVYFAKVRKNNTVFMEKGFKNVDTHNGIFVDIFPFDPVVNDKTEIKKYKIKVKLLLELFKYKVYWTAPLYKGVKLKYIIGNIIRVLIHVALIPVKREYLYNRLDKQVQKYKNQGLKSYTSKLLNGCITIDDILPTRESIFEDGIIPIPSKSEKLLTMIYGNYNELPPVDKRKGHKPLELSFDNSED